MNSLWVTPALGESCLPVRLPLFMMIPHPFLAAFLGRSYQPPIFTTLKQDPAFPTWCPHAVPPVCWAVLQSSVPPSPFYYPPSLSEKNNSNWHLKVNLQGTSNLFVNKTIQSVDRAGITTFTFQEENRLNKGIHVFPTAVEQPWVIDTLFNTQFSHLLTGCSDKRLQF